MYDVLPGKASFNRVYDWFVERLYDYPVKINQTHMTGSVRNYMAIILGTLSIITFAFMFMTGGFTFSTEDLAEITILEISIIIIKIGRASCRERVYIIEYVVIIKIKANYYR